MQNETESNFITFFFGKSLVYFMVTFKKLLDYQEH